MLGGRREAPLQEVAAEVEATGGQGWIVVDDVPDGSTQQRPVQAAQAHFDGPGILINSAGVVRAGRIEQEREDMLARIDTNVIAPIRSTRGASRCSREAGTRRSSTCHPASACSGWGFHATCAATNAGIARFGEALRRELHGEGKHVMTIYPGATETPMMETAGFGSEHGVSCESAEAFADALIGGLEHDEAAVVRGGMDLFKANLAAPAAVDQQTSGTKPRLEHAASRHRHL